MQVLSLDLNYMAAFEPRLPHISVRCDQWLSTRKSAHCEDQWLLGWGHSFAPSSAAQHVITTVRKWTLHCTVTSRLLFNSCIDWLKVQYVTLHMICIIYLYYIQYVISFRNKQNWNKHEREVSESWIHSLVGDPDFHMSHSWFDGVGRQQLPFLLCVNSCTLFRSYGLTMKSTAFCRTLLTHYWCEKPLKGLKAQQ